MTRTEDLLGFRQARRNARVYSLVLFIALSATKLAGVVLGSATIPPGEVLRVLWTNLTGEPAVLTGVPKNAILGEILVPSVVLGAALAGVCLAVARAQEAMTPVRLLLARGRGPPTQAIALPSLFPRLPAQCCCSYPKSARAREIDIGTASTIYQPLMCEWPT